VVGVSDEGRGGRWASVDFDVGEDAVGVRCCGCGKAGFTYGDGAVVWRGVPGCASEGVPVLNALAVDCVRKLV
jgi:hypothetical protein